MKRLTPMQRACWRGAHRSNPAGTLASIFIADMKFGSRGLGGEMRVARKLVRAWIKESKRLMRMAESWQA